MALFLKAMTALVFQTAVTGMPCSVYLYPLMFSTECELTNLPLIIMRYFLDPETVVYNKNLLWAEEKCFSK